jgi:hypothetical protein
MRFTATCAAARFGDGIIDMAKLDLAMTYRRVVKLWSLSLFQLARDLVGLEKEIVKNLLCC